MRQDFRPSLAEESTAARTRGVALALGLLLLFAAGLPGQVLPGNNHEVKYIILMVPDGMNLPSVTAARIKLHGITGPPLYMERLEHIGYQRTYSRINTVTDSSAAASAWACGEEFVSNEVCFHLDGSPNNPTLLELAKWRGMSTGLVATQTITHATPASFGSHVDAPPGVKARSCECEIARQYVTVTQPDVLLGGGRSKFAPSAPDVCGVMGNYIAEAQSRGYAYVSTPAGLAAAVAAKPERLRVEGSLVDSGNHATNLDYMVGEMKAFDESVKAVLDWVLPDHETGALAVHGTETAGGSRRIPAGRTTRSRWGAVRLLLARPHLAGTASYG